jgi:hypothetical protein
VQLAIVDVGFTSPLHATVFFQTTFFPSLRALALSACNNTTAHKHFFPELVAPFMEQLDVLQLKWNRFVDRNPPSLFSSTTPTLYTDSAINDSRRLQALLTAAPQHLRIVPHTRTDPNWQTSLSTALSTLSDLSILVASPSKPLSLHLPVFWRTVDSDKYPDTVEAVAFHPGVREE